MVGLASESQAGRARSSSCMSHAQQAGRSRRSRGLAVTVLLHVLSNAPASGQMQRLVGGSLTWEVNPEFLSGGARRTVTFELRTSWAVSAVAGMGGQAAVNGCDNLAKVTKVSCPRLSATLMTSSLPASRCNSDPKLQDGCGVAERFGVLCVAQLVRQQVNGKYYAKYMDPNAQCVSEANAHLSSVLEFGSYLGDADKKPKVCGPDASASCTSKIGVPNKFMVQQIYSEPISNVEGPSSVGRKPGPSVVVTGVLHHTVLIDSDVSEVVAWLAPRTGHANLDQRTGLLLEGCSSAAAGTPCMFNECSLQRTRCSAGQGCFTGAAFRIAALDSMYAASDAFWLNWGTSFDGVLGCGSGKACLRSASPALETFVPLCSLDPTSTRKCSRGLNNYYSPATSLPDIIEVAITPATKVDASDARAPFVYTGYNPYQPGARPELTAPHQAFRVQSFDYDGQQMTQYSPQLYSELKAGGNGHKFGRGDFDIALGVNPVVQCTPTQDSHCCRRGTNSPPGGVRSMRVDCVAEDVSPVGDRRWPSVKASTPSSGVPTTEASGCRFIFDYDRDPARKQGNLIKPDFPFSDIPTSSFTQHVINTIDFPFSDVDNPVLTSNHIDNERLNWAPREETGGGQAIVQNIFSMFSCNSGTQNQPPVFTTSLTSTDLRVNTVYECPFYRPCDKNGCPCEIDLYARDFQMTAGGEDARTSATLRTAEAANRVDIQYALGYDHLPMADLKSAAGIACTTGTACQGHAHFKYKFQPAEMMDSVTGFFRPHMIGKIVVRCFVAYDVFTQQTAQARSCPSMPLCIKIKVTGTKPQFVEPTPLGESFDDNGILVPDRHDYAACQGFPMQLKLTVKDSMPADVRRKISESAVSRGYLQDLKFRIFVEDKDVGFNRNTALKISYQYLNVGGGGNQDFFSTETVPVSSAAKEKCGAFSGYGAWRKGNNDAQDSPDPMAGQGRSKSVMSPYKSVIEYCSCTTPRSDPWCDCPAGSVREAQASLTVVFESDLAARRGLLLRDECRSIDLTGIDQVPIGTPDSTEYELANCREKLTNIDQVICAVGYDNARSVYKRWVGNTDPNGDDKKHWRRDHSNGDQASDMHCFRIFIAAPPVFVTDPTGTITPFSNKWSSFVDTTGVRAAYKEISFRVNQTRDLTFLAQDPNPTDVIEIFIMAEPGIPKGMTIGSNDCILRKGENSMCKVDDQIDRAIYPDEDWKATMAYNAASRCSRAKRTVSWTPPGDAAGHMFKVCAVARDNSNLCFGTVSDFATPRGWFGEQQCILIDVLRLLVKWGGDFVNLGSNPWTVKAYVGCEFKFHLTVSDALVDPNNAGDVPYALEAMLQDTGLPHVTTTAHSGTSGIGIPQGLAAATLHAVWVPRRRTEGKIFRICFAARDLAGVLSTPTDLVCRGGSKHLLGCHSDGDCAGGVCQKACVEVEVQRCEYCIKDTDTLTWMTRYFGIESNWMRLWALNSFERGNALTRNVQGAIFPPAQPKIDGSSSNAYITDPDTIISTSHRVYVGVVYRALQGDTVLEVAARFRTTVKTLLAMNPDVEDDTSALSGEQRLCLVPCTADAD